MSNKIGFIKNILDF